MRSPSERAISGSRPSGKTYHAPAIKRGAWALAGGGLLLWWVARRPFRVAVQGTSMLPTLQPGDLLLATGAGRLRAGILVVLEHPGKHGFELVKRLAHLPGQRVEGRVLGPDEYWVVGDHVSASSDSRAFGAVRRTALRGVVRARYWPPRRFKVLLMP